MRLKPTKANRFLFIAPTANAAVGSAKCFPTVAVQKCSTLREVFRTYGRFKHAVNLPLSNVSLRIASMPADKKIMVVDERRKDRPVAEELLTKNGFMHVSVIFNGLAPYLSEVP